MKTKTYIKIKDVDNRLEKKMLSKKKKLTIAWGPRMKKNRRIEFWQLLDNLTIAWGPRLLNKETIRIGFWQQPDNFDNVDNCLKTEYEEKTRRIGFWQPLENVDNWLEMKPCKDCPAGKGGWSRTIPIWTRLINLIIWRRRPTKKHSYKIRQNPALCKVLFGAVS